MLPISAALLLVSALLLGAAPLPHTEDPPVPRFPPVFRSNFTSRWKNTTGTYALGRSADGRPAEAIVLRDGTRDHLCSQSHNGTACVQLTAHGARYHVFPELSPPDCCVCCRYDRGAYPCGGPLSPEWVSNRTGNLVFMGVATVGGRACYKWNAVGLSGDFNYYYQDLQGRPCEIDGYNYLRNPQEQADDQYIFVPSTFSVDVHPDMFTVPEACTRPRACGPPVCAARALPPATIS